MGWGEALLNIASAAMSSSAVSSANRKIQKSMDDIIRQAGVTTGQQGALYQPYGQLGQESLNRLNALENAAATGDFSMLTGSPEYQFLKQQGESDLARNLAARGGLFGGQAQKQFAQFNNALALQAALNPYVSRQQAGIDTGMRGAAGQSNALGTYLDYYGNARGIKGQSSADSRIARNNAWQKAIESTSKMFPS